MSVAMDVRVPSHGAVRDWPSSLLPSVDRVKKSTASCSRTWTPASRTPCAARGAHPTPPRRGEVAPSNEQLTTLRQSCYVLARTRPESTWSNTDACAADDLSGDEFISCLEMVFEVSL